MAKTSAKTTTKKEFCESLDWRLKLQWFDKTGIFKFKDGRIARIELDTNGTFEHYVGFRVTILNPKEGQVDTKMFLFDDYLDRTEAGRSDDRVSGPHKYPHNGAPCHYEVIAHTGWHWFITVPKSTLPLCTAIQEYIAAFGAFG